MAQAVGYLTKPPVGKEGKQARDQHYYETIAHAPLIVRVVKCADRYDNLRSMPHLDQPARLTRYIHETRRYLLPMAQISSPELYQALKEICDSFV